MQNGYSWTENKNENIGGAHGNGTWHACVMRESSRCRLIEVEGNAKEEGHVSHSLTLNQRRCSKVNSHTHLQRFAGNDSRFDIFPKNSDQTPAL